MIRNHNAERASARRDSTAQAWIVTLFGLALSVAALATPGEGFAEETARTVATECLRHIQKPTLLAPELICLPASPKVKGRPTST